MVDAVFTCGESNVIIGDYDRNIMINCESKQNAKKMSQSLLQGDEFFYQNFD